MAVTKIWAIHDSVSRVVDYCSNPEKTRLTDLEQVLIYAANKAKTLDEGEQSYAVTGYLSFFRCVAIVLGVAPLYEKEYRQPLSAECREACRRLDRFTAEITLVCREHLDTPEDVQRFLARMDKEMDAISAARSKIRNKQRGCADPAERVELKKSCAACTAELSRLRKQKQTAYNMIEDNPKLKDLLACEWDAWVENAPYLSPREKQALRNQRPPQEEKTIIR